MANWKKKEAGFMVISNKGNPAQFFCEKFHNMDEMVELEQKYKWINADIEYHIGSFANSAEIENAMNNVVREPFFIETLDYSPRRKLDIEWINVTEREVQEKWNEVKAQGRLYTDEEAEELGLNEWYGYNWAQDSEGRQKINELIAQDRLTTDLDKALFYYGAQKHIVMPYYKLSELDR